MQARAENLNCWVTPCCFSGTRRTGNDAVDGRFIGVDVDLKSSDPSKPVFGSKAEAVAALRQAVAAGMPAPTFVIDSGRGIHLWFEFSKAFDTIGNKRSRYAAACQAVWALLENANPAFVADTSRRGDLAGLLRMPETSNLKSASEPLPVSFYQDEHGHASTGAALSQSAIDGVMPASKASDARAPSYLFQLPRFSTNLLSTSGLEAQLAVDDFNVVVDRCPALQLYFSHRVSLDYDLWWPPIRLATFAKNGREWAHKFSEGHPTYDPHLTDQKFDQLTDTGALPPTCDTLAARIDPTLSVCAGCPAKACGVKWPLLNPGRPAQAEVPDASPPAQPAEAPSYDNTVPEHLKGRGNFTVTADYSTCLRSDGDEEGPTLIRLADHGIWGSHLVYNRDEARYDLVFKVARLKRGELVVFDVEVPVRAMNGDWRGVVAPFADKGVGILAVAAGARNIFSEFLLRELNMVRDNAEAAHVTHMGWQDDGNFAVGDTLITPRGPARARLAGNAEASKDRFERRGTLAGQIETLKLYERFGSDAAKFVLALSAGSPIHGLVMGKGSPLVVLNGCSASGKTALCRAAVSIWAAPDRALLTPRDTTLAAYGRAGVMHNLPVVQDEITFSETSDLVDMVHALSSGGDRGTMRRNQMLNANTPSWAGMALWTSNTSVVDQLKAVSFAVDAVANRVLEFTVNDKTLGLPDPAALADVDLSYNKHCGHVGVELAKLFVAEKDRYAAMYESAAVTAASFVPGGRTGPLRYWCQIVQTAIVGFDALKRVGAMDVSDEYMTAVARRLIAQANAESASVRATADALIREFVNGDKSAVLYVTKLGTPNPARPNEPPVHQYVGGDAKAATCRVEQHGKHLKIQVSKAAFAEWARRRGSTLDAVIAKAHREGLVRDLGNVEYRFDLYSNLMRLDRNATAMVGFIEIDVLEFWIKAKDKTEASAETHTVGGSANVVKFPGEVR